MHAFCLRFSAKSPVFQARGEDNEEPQQQGSRDACDSPGQASNNVRRIELGDEMWTLFN